LDLNVDAALVASFAIRRAGLAAKAAGGKIASKSIWDAVSADVRELSDAEEVVSRARSPLWQENLPDWFVEHWRLLKARLLEADEGWEVWTDWYEDRLHGRPFDKALEEARVLIPDEIWQQGPKAVNTGIARLIETHAV